MEEQGDKEEKSQPIQSEHEFKRPKHHFKRIFIILTVSVAFVLAVTLFVNYNNGQYQLQTSESGTGPPQEPSSSETGQPASPAETTRPLPNIPQPTEGGGYLCPKDYCTKEVLGAGPCPSWTGVDGTYYDQECYDYPNNANTAAGCDTNKIVYYRICGVRKI